MFNFSFLDINCELRSFWTEQKHAFPDAKRLFISSVTSFLLVTYALKYLNLFTFSMISFLIVMYLFPSSSVFRFVIMYFVFSTFPCRPTSSQASTKTSVLLCSASISSPITSTSSAYTNSWFKPWVGNPRYQKIDLESKSSTRTQAVCSIYRGFCEPEQSCRV